MTLKKGDTIKCRDVEDGANVAEDLNKFGIEWDFVYERGGEKGIWIEIQSDECISQAK